LQTICEAPEINVVPGNNNEECIQTIIKRLEEKSKSWLHPMSDAYWISIELHIFLLINNIDGMNFRNSHVQNIFKWAAQSTYIHILATLDHIHGPLSERNPSMAYEENATRSLQSGINRVWRVFDGFGTLFTPGQSIKKGDHSMDRCQSF
jgi:hypothetical protein